MKVFDNIKEGDTVYYIDENDINIYPMYMGVN